MLGGGKTQKRKETTLKESELMQRLLQVGKEEARELFEGFVRTQI